jgi:hypothetical protein
VAGLRVDRYIASELVAMATGWLARKVEAGFLDEEEARRLAWGLAYGLVRRTYRLDA